MARFRVKYHDRARKPTSMVLQAGRYETTGSLLKFFEKGYIVEAFLVGDIIDVEELKEKD